MRAASSSQARTRSRAKERASGVDALDLDAVARAVAPLVVAQLAAALTSASSPAWSTRKGQGPPGIAAREWRRIAPTVPGAYRMGRWTTVPRAAFDAWAAQRANISPVATSMPAANDEPAWTPAAALASIGLRRSGGR